MSDLDRDEEGRVDREPIRERDTTIIHTDTDRGGRGSGTIIAVVLLLAVLALLYFLFAGNGLNRAADEVGVNVNVDAPDVTIPDVEVPDVELKVPDNVDLPDVDVKTGDGDGNTAG